MLLMRRTSSSFNARYCEFSEGELIALSRFQAEQPHLRTGGRFQFGWAATAVKIRDPDDEAIRTEIVERIHGLTL